MSSHIYIVNGLTWLQREANKRSADLISSSNAKARSNCQTRKRYQWQCQRVQNFLLSQGRSDFYASQAFTWLREAHQDKESSLLYSVYWFNTHLTQDTLTETPRIVFDHVSTHLMVHASWRTLLTITEHWLIIHSFIIRGRRSHAMGHF